MRIPSPKRAGAALLAAWTALVCGALYWGGEPLLRWALRHGAWSAGPDQSEGTEAPAESEPASGWNVPLSPQAEVWQQWRKQQWRRLRRLEPERLQQEVTALLELLDSPSLELAPSARKELVGLLEQLYNHLAAGAPGSRWVLLARVQQVRKRLLAAQESPQDAAAQVALAQGSAPPARSSGKRNRNRSPTPQSQKTEPPAASGAKVPIGGQAFAPGNEAPRGTVGTPQPLARGVANQARELSREPRPSGNDGNRNISPDQEGPPFPSRLPAGERATLPTPRETALRNRVAARARAAEPLWPLWRRWQQAANPAEKQALWDRIVSAGVPPQVRQSLYELGTGTPGRKARALERLAEQLGPGANPWLWWAAEDASEPVRLAALSLLAAGGDPLQLRRVYRAAQGDESPRIRRLARQIKRQLR